MTEQYYYGNNKYEVWYDESTDSWSWKLVGKHWEWLQETGQMPIISGEGLGSWDDACEEAKRVLND